MFPYNIIATSSRPSLVTSLTYPSGSYLYKVLVSGKDIGGSTWDCVPASGSNVHFELPVYGETGFDLSHVFSFDVVHQCDSLSIDMSARAQAGSVNIVSYYTTSAPTAPSSGGGESTPQNYIPYNDWLFINSILLFFLAFIPVMAILNLLKGRKK